MSELSNFDNRDIVGNPKIWFKQQNLNPEILASPGFLFLSAGARSVRE
jgi:hypothetical protein